MENKAPYEILGYYIETIRYSHFQMNANNIQINAEILGKTDKQIDLKIIVSLWDNPKEKSIFSYVAGFKIYDKVIDESMNDNIKISSFVGIIFPFIRESIFNITKTITLPLIDLRGADMREGITFAKK